MEKIIKAESAKGQNYIEMFNKSRYYSVEQFYNKPSSAKVSAEMSIRTKSECKAYRVLSGNSFSFTAGWIDKEDRLHIETSCQSYIII